MKVITLLTKKKKNLKKKDKERNSGTDSIVNSQQCMKLKETKSHIANSQVYLT